jgi:hypothetical protein
MRGRRYAGGREIGRHLITFSPRRLTLMNNATSKSWSSPAVIPVSLAILLASCSADTKPTAQRDVSQPEAALPDAARSDSNGCHPGCHWDCLMRDPVACLGGKVFQTLRAPIPCCKPTDTPPPEYPSCLWLNRPLYSCTSFACRTPDPRYAACFQTWAAFAIDFPSQLTHLLKLYCPEGAPHVAGDPCISDEDCSPADKDPLQCDGNTKRCITMTRPIAPIGFMEDCGLRPKDFGLKDAFDHVGPFK